MKVAITGADGQLGTALSRTFPSAWTCVALPRSTLDLTDLGSIRPVISAHAPDLIINAAAWTAVDRAEDAEEAALLINGTAVGELASVARDVGARFVQVSTDYVFDGQSNRPYSSQDPCNPLSAYGRSKLAGEKAAGSQATIVRTSWVYGPTHSNFLLTMLRLMGERPEIRVVSDQIGSPTMVSGLARAIWALSALDLAGIWHHADAGVASWYDFAVAIQEEALALGLLDQTVRIIPIATADYPTPAKRPPMALLDSTQTRRALGLPAVHWRENLRQALKQIKDRQ